MIKKIILKRGTQAIINKAKLRKFVAKGGKIKKLPSQSSPIKSGKWTDVDADMKARSKFDEIFDSSEDNIYQGVKILSVRKAAAESLASKTAIKKWNKSLPKHIKRSRSTIASFVKSNKGKVSKVGIEKAKIKSFQKVLDRKDLQFETIRSKTSQLFTGRSGKNPLQHKLVDTKFITTKKYRKGKPVGVTERDLLWAPRGTHGESFSKLSGAAHHERQRKKDWFNKPETIEALAKGKTTKSKVYGAWLKDEAKRRQEFAKSFDPVKQYIRSKKKK